MADDEATRRELMAHERRLAALREKAALLGYATDPATTLEIADIEQAIATLRQRIGDVPTVSAAPSTPVTPLATAGDTITATISGSSHVVVGKQITQQFGSALPEDADQRIIAAALDALDTMLVAAGASSDAPMAAMAAFQIKLLRGELLKRADDGAPSANVVMQVGEWLLANTPAIAPSLGSLFASPACQRALERASPAALTWAQQHFSAPPRG